MGGRCCRWPARKIGPLQEPDIAPAVAAETAFVEIAAVDAPLHDAAKAETCDPIAAGGLAGLLDPEDTAAKEVNPLCPHCGLLHGGALELIGSVSVENLFGWYCENYYICGEAESSGAGRWRWSCQSCHRDYCRDCYLVLKDGGDLASVLHDMETSNRDELNGVKAATLDLIQMRSEIHGIPLPPTDWDGEVVEGPAMLTADVDQTRQEEEKLSAAKLPFLLPPMPPPAQGPSPQAALLREELEDEGLAIQNAIQEARMVEEPDQQSRALSNMHPESSAVGEAGQETLMDAATGETAAFLIELMRRPKLPDEFETQHQLEKLIVEHRLSSQGFSVGERCEGKAASGKWWPVIITARHPDGTYAVDVEDGAGGKWPVVYSENLRCAPPKPKPEPKQAAVEGSLQKMPTRCSAADARVILEQIPEEEEVVPNIAALQDRLDALSSELASERQQAAAQLAAVKDEHAAELVKLRTAWEDEKKHLQADLKVESESRREHIQQMQRLQSEHSEALLAGQQRLEKLFHEHGQQSQKLQDALSEVVAANSRADTAVASLAHFKEQAVKDGRTRQSLEIAQKRLSVVERQMLLQLCFKSWVICCAQGPAELKEEAMGVPEAETNASSLCASGVEPKDAGFDVSVAAVNSRAERLQAELDAVAARIALKEEELQVAFKSAMEVQMQDCRQSYQVFAEFAKSLASQQVGTSSAPGRLHVELAAAEGFPHEAKQAQLPELDAASDALECADLSSLEVFVTYATGFPSLSKLSMKFGCGRRKEALMATMQVHPLQFDLGGCSDTGSKAYVNGSASFSLRTSSIVGEATLVLHPLRDRYNICLCPPDTNSELVAGLPADPEILAQEPRTQLSVTLDLCVRGSTGISAIISHAAEKVHPYLRRHALEQYMASLLRTMAHEKAEDPCAFMREQFGALAHGHTEEGLANDGSAVAPDKLPAGMLEVSLHGAEGLPEDAVLYFTGPVQGKVPALRLLQGQTLRLPIQNGTRETFKVTVLQAEHETTLHLEPAQQHYLARLQPAPAQRELGLHVRRVKTSPTTDAVRSESAEKNLRSARPRDSARQYIQLHGLITLTQELLRDLITEQPVNPYKFLLDRLDSRKTPCSGKSLTCSGSVPADAELVKLERQLSEMRALLAKVADGEE